MAIKRSSCRTTERKRMRNMADEGYSAAQISNADSVIQPLVDSVLNGEWDKQEKSAAQAQKDADLAKAGAAEAAEVRKAAAIAAATAQAIQSANEINEDLSPQARGAITKKLKREQEQATG